MQTLLLVIAALAVSSAEWTGIDWSRVKPIEEFDHYWARIPKEWQFLRDLTPPSPRITNGQEATPGQFPYQAVVITNFESVDGLCGGVVLTRNYILTAGHCVFNVPAGMAIVGIHHRTDSEPSQQSINFVGSDVRVHEGYNPNNIRNDIAVIRMNRPIDFNARVQPVRIPAAGDSRNFAGLTGTVSGFGRWSDFDQSNSAVLRFARNPIITEADCLAGWGNDAGVIQPQNICLSGEGGRSPCHGDSGGPLTIVDNGSPLLVGIVSFGPIAFCSIGMPSVYVRVTHFRQWIVNNSDFS